MCDLEMIAAWLMFSVVGATAGALAYLTFKKKKVIHQGAKTDYLE